MWHFQLCRAGGWGGGAGGRLPRQLSQGSWSSALHPRPCCCCESSAPLPTALLGGGRSAAGWAGSWAQTPAFPHASLDFGSAARACKGCGPRSSSPRSSSSSGPWAWAAGRGAGAGDGTSCGDASSLPRWGRGQGTTTPAGCKAPGPGLPSVWSHSSFQRGFSPPGGAELATGPHFILCSYDHKARLAQAPSLRGSHASTRVHVSILRPSGASPGSREKPL